MRDGKLAEIIEVLQSPNMIGLCFFKILADKRILIHNEFQNWPIVQ
jgi:hypothetical protein